MFLEGGIMHAFADERELVLARHLWQMITITRCFTEWLDINCCVRESIGIAADMNNVQVSAASFHWMWILTGSILLVDLQFVLFLKWVWHGLISFWMPLNATEATINMTVCRISHNAFVFICRELTHARRFPPLSHFLSTKTCLPAAKWRRINLTNENKYRQRCLTLIKAGSRTQREDWCTTSRVFWVCRWPVFYPDVSLWALIMRIYSWPLVLDAGHTHQLQKHEQRGLFLTLYWGSQCLKSRFNERLKASLSFVVYADTLFARSFVIKTLLIVLLQWAILHTCNP